MNRRQSRKLGVVVGVWALVAFSNFAQAGPLYQLDDGSRETAVGNNAIGNPPVAWLNAFAAPPGGDSIFQVSVMFGGPAAGNQALFGHVVDIVVWDDPNGDGNPTDASVLAMQTHNIVAHDGGAFDIIELVAPVPVVGGFFVGVYADFSDITNVFPRALDEDTLIPGTSWVVRDAGGLDLDDLGSANFLASTDQTNFPGVFMIRANGIPEPGTIALMAFGLAALGLERRRRKKSMN